MDADGLTNEKGRIDMLKNIIGGMAVGIANIIPGVRRRYHAGHTWHFWPPDGKHIGSVQNPHQETPGVDCFSCSSPCRSCSRYYRICKIIDWLFASWSTQTFFWFVGLVLFSIPTLLKSELKGERISWPLLAVGTVVIFAISYFSPEKTDLIVTVFPELSMPYVLLLIVVGMISGAAMLFPGISGSLVLLIIGQYYIFKSYIANVTSFRLEVIIPLGFIAVGVALGILLSAKGDKPSFEKTTGVKRSASS